MSHKINEAIQDIAVRHGVVLGKDDPILILQTMNDKLLEENRKAQQQMLAQFKEEMENISSQWKDDAKEKAEKVLNAALASSKEAMANLLRDSTSHAIETMQSMISDALAEVHNLTRRTQKFGHFLLRLSLATVISGLFFLFFIF